MVVDRCEQKKLEALLKAGKTAPEIAGALQRTPASIYARLLRLDLKRKRSTRQAKAIAE